jgi:hypothetical protein
LYLQIADLNLTSFQSNIGSNNKESALETFSRLQTFLITFSLSLCQQQGLAGLFFLI